MKQTQQSMALAGLLALALITAGCKSMHGDSGARGSSGASGTTSSDVIKDDGLPTSKPGDTSGSTGTTGTGTGSGTGAEPVIRDETGTSGSAGSGTGTSGLQDDRGNTAAASATPANSTVLVIEALPQSRGITEGDSTMGTSGAAGATGSSDSGQSWRVTVRMDDGSTQVVNHSGTPDFRSGDRINVTSGAIQR